MASLPFQTIPNSNPVSSKPSIPTQTLQTSRAHFPPSKSYFSQISTLSKQSQIQEAVDLLIQIDLPNNHIAPEIYGELLQACVYDRALQTGQQIHARIIKKGQTFSKNEYIETKLVIFYAKCDAAKASSSLFRRVRVKNVFSWAAVIGLNCRLGCYKEALLGFIEMHEDGFLPDNFVVPNVLKACGAGEWIGSQCQICNRMGHTAINCYNRMNMAYEGRVPTKTLSAMVAGLSLQPSTWLTDTGANAHITPNLNNLHQAQEYHGTEHVGGIGGQGTGRGVHGFVVKMGLNECVFVASSLVDMYGKCRVVEEARRVFDETSEPNVITWNSMIVGYVQNGMNEKAIGVFCDMRGEGVEPSPVTVSSFLSASANLGAVEEGRQGHALAVFSGLELSAVLGSSILNFYSKVGLIEDAEIVFSRMNEKDVVTWNLLISGYVQNQEVDKALEMCRKMRLENFRFDSVTLATLMLAFADTRNLKFGKEAHCYCIRNNLEDDVVVASSIVDLYAKCEKINSARLAFESATTGDLVLWNTMLAAYAGLGHTGEALNLFYQMELESVPPNIMSWNSLIFGFLKNDQVNEAKDMFFQMQSLSVEPNLVTWTTMISGLADNGLGQESIQTFLRMQEAGIKPNVVTVICVLKACIELASLRNGKVIHGYLIRRSLYLSTRVSTSLIDMYAKCGSVEEAKRVFDMVSDKELPIYNAMISSFALHGQAVEALALYKRLKEKGLQPDSVTFTNALYACSHASMVKEGLELLDDLLSSQTVNPSIEHYGCVVSLLSRSGNVDEAFSLIEAMPYEPDAQILGSLLAACREHNNIELEEYLSNQLLKLEPENSGNYVAISNAYADARRWDEVKKVRKMMREKGLSKSPGCSWIQVGEEAHAFVAGDKSHPEAEQIYSTLESLE